MNQQDLSVLVISPHALDEVLGCGGTIKKSTAAGQKVKTLVLFGDGSGRDQKRRTAAIEVAALLGCEQPEFSGFPENRSDTIPLGEIISVIETAIRDDAPNTVYVPTNATLNIDHRTTFDAAVTALRPAPAQNVGRVLAYEIASSTNWAPQAHGPIFRPTCYVDISDHLEAKCEALTLYGDEIPPSPHGRSKDLLVNLARMRGESVGLNAAEAFELVREIT